MSITEAFSSLCESLLLDYQEEMETSVKEIAKKLNKQYYDLDGDSESHMYIVGSVGRNTAIKNASDLDLVFDLPQETFKKYDDYESNGQSKLLQDVKAVLEERYPNTKLKGDGQVVVIEFNAYTVELVPGFMQADERFKCPNTHDGGSWYFSDPISEQKECEKSNKNSKGTFYDFCHIIRCMRNNMGFSMGGLLIDTLIYNHFKDNDYYGDSDYDDYLDIFISVLEYLKKQDKDQQYWLAVGSKQQVINTDHGAWIAKVKKAYKDIDAAGSDEQKQKEVLNSLLGKDFPKPESSRKRDNTFSSSREQFIENMVPVDIVYSLRIECKVTQDGWRPTLLRELLRKKQLLKHNKKLDFFIENTNCPKPYEICWKVRNVGEEAIRRNCIRGEIKKTNNIHQIEHTCFYGPHYVECYLIKNGICVARDKIDVPIDWY